MCCYTSSHANVNFKRKKKKTFLLHQGRLKSSAQADTIRREISKISLRKEHGTLVSGQQQGEGTATSGMNRGLNLRVDLSARSAQLTRCNVSSSHQPKRATATQGLFPSVTLIYRTRLRCGHNVGQLHHKGNAYYYIMSQHKYHYRCSDTCWQRQGCDTAAGLDTTELCN